MGPKHGSGGRWIQILARIGYASRGVIYLLIALFAFLAALGAGEDAEGTEGALERTLLAPFGVVLVAALAVGLVGYSIWRLCQALLDADDHGTDLRGLTVRGALLASSLTHLVLAFGAAVSVAELVGATRSERRAGQEWTAWLMAQPFGSWLVGLVGVAMIGAGAAHFWKGYREGFEKHFYWSPAQRRWLTPVCSFGLYARSVILVIIGGLLIHAALRRREPEEAGGIEEALDWLQVQPYGVWLLGAMALGLGAFGVYSLTETFVRRVDLPAD